MITIHETPLFPETYPLDRLGKREDLLFFDIETTGFSGEYSNLYLVGCVYYEGGRWNLVQWFADTVSAEKEVLVTFFEFLRRFPIVVHFNGDGFDIPYLLKRCRAYDLPYDFSGVTSLDIYKKIRPYRNLLGLESMKQKAIEQFLGVGREDIYSGGQLIEVYKDYLFSHEQVLLDMLLLHNADDLRGMPGILPILNYPDYLEHGFTLEGQELLTRNEGELKYFYPDYKNYYYLIYEDRAIHKSVAEYVDREARIKATAKTCYTRRAGCYLPQFAPIFDPVLQKEYKDRITYFPYDDRQFAEQERNGGYVRHLLDYLCSK